MIRYWPYGPHCTTGNYLDGIGDIWRDLNSRGVPCHVKCVDGYGPIYELMQIGDAHGVENVCVYRLGTAGGILWGVPNWHASSPQAAAHQHVAKMLEYLPPEFDKRVWLEVINEPDKDEDVSLGWTAAEYASWLGYFSVACAEKLNALGYKHLAYGYSSGESEIEDWETEGQLAYLRYCDAHHEKAGLALHEYSYQPAELAVDTWLIGRFTRIFDVCDAYSLRRPKVAITEFGWTLWEVPEPEIAIPQLAHASDDLYAKHPEILGVAIWHYGSGWKNIKYKAHRLLEPMHKMAKAYRLEIEGSDTMNLLKNWSFEEDNWTHLDESQRQQVPQGWKLLVQKSGNVRGNEITTTPECVHKGKYGGGALPESEWNWLILDGDQVFKLFAKGTWRVSLQQTVQAKPGSIIRAEFPTNIHFDERGAEYDPEDTRVYLQLGSAASEWYMSKELDRKWVAHELYSVVPESGSITFTAVMDVKWGHSTAFFCDAAVLEIEDERPPEPPPELDCFGMSPIDYRKLAHVLPQDASRALFLHVLDATYDRRESIMYSWHDACMGNLTDKTAVFWEIPESEKVSVETWVKENFPGTKIEYRYMDIPDPPTGRTVDLMPYFFPQDAFGPTYELRHPNGSQERIQHQRIGNLLYIVKGFGGRDGKSEWEQLRVDEAHIWRGTDTSPGGGRFYRQFETGRLMAKWCKRHMYEGETYFGSGHEVQFYLKENCDESKPNSGPAQNVIKFVQRHDSKTWNGVTVEDVIELQQPGGEKWFFARDIGMVAWESSWGASAISEQHLPGTRPNLEREELPCSFV